MARPPQAEEAQQVGLINRIFSVETYLDEALKIAAEIAARAPVAIQVAKECIKKAHETILAEGVAFEGRSFHFLFGTEDQTEGMKAFIEKRDAKWTGE